MTTHRLGGTPAYLAWHAMLSRCQSQKHNAYAMYGGRGITVCDRWQSVVNFVADMGQPPPGHELDRINNDGDYEPSNCRWADKKTQMRNRRNTRFVTHDGVTRPLGEWAEVLDVPYKRLQERYRTTGRLIPTRHYRLRAR